MLLIIIIICNNNIIFSRRRNVHKTPRPDGLWNLAINHSVLSLESSVWGSYVYKREARLRLTIAMMQKGSLRHALYRTDRDLRTALVGQDL
jgi:hypothetical protein